MLDKVFNRPYVLARLRGGPFGELIDDFAARLQAQGYTRSTIRSRIGAVEHFGSWLRSRPLSSRRPSQEAIRCFLFEHLPSCRCPLSAMCSLNIVRPALTQLLQFLRDRGLSEPASAAPKPAVVAVEQYCRHLRDTCGLAEDTCLARARYAREFLEGKFGQGPVRWQALQPGDAMSFVIGFAKRCQPSSAQVAASALRSFLRYLQFCGWCSPSLVAAVPRIAHWQLSHLPKAMTDEQLGKFLAFFDRATPTGKRDYAMALCLVDLGLRVSEVTDLLLDDLNWHAASLRVAASKAGRARELPLSRRVGQAIADYLRHGRPKALVRQVFVRHRRLQGTAVSASVVRGVMALAYDKVPGCEQWTGTHVLRHTVATRLLSRGANFKEIADLLGHRCLNTTAIYAKVNLPSLIAVALPWPEVQK